MHLMVGQRSQQGATMIEVLVALFLLAVGLLGTLALQNTGQRSNQSAMFSSVAIVLARDMANRITANDNKMLTTDNNFYDKVDTNGVGGEVPVCEANCDKAAIKAMDVGEWAEQLRTKLPAGRGKVAVSADGLHTVTVMWDDERTGAEGDGCSGNPQNDLTCVTLEFRLQ